MSLGLRHCDLGHAACVLAGLALLLSSASSGAAAEPAASAVPLTKVVLFNSGVGFFEHNADVEGDAHVDLKFNVDDINDLLKSMVLQDLGGGRISTITYGSMDPITKTLKTFAIDLTTNPTLADLLGQIRGEQVELETPNKVQGTILGVEKRRQPVEKGEAVEVEFLNLLTDEGLRSLPLADVGRIKLVNQQLDSELRQALSILALGHATDKKTVTLNFLGQGQRAVRVGYIQESPIWKTSYRLVLDDNEPPYLQGWAIVENTTEEDWKQVALTLVSGRPISFVMNLYQPLYVPRPIVEPELFASLRPQTYGQDLAQADAQFEKQAAKARRKSGVADDAAPPAPGAAGERFANGTFGLGGRGAVPADGREMALRGEALHESIASVANAADVGEMFQYAIESPVDLPRQQSAMLPIVNGSVEGSKVSIYNPRVHAKHPLNGLKLKNTSGLHLMQGPITVFDDGAYAGDARIEDLQPGTERLISYAMDLGTEVATESKAVPEQLLYVRLVKGTLQSARKLQRSTHYVVKNSSQKVRHVLVEYPVDGSWKLTAPAKPEEKTRDLYRFAVEAEPGTPAALVVEEEQVVNQEVALTNLDDGTILFYVNAAVVSDEVKAALTQLVERKQEIEQLTVEQTQMEQRIAAIGQEQTRIRENMAQLDRKSDLYIRYVKKFSEQEDTVEQLRTKIADLQDKVTGLRQKLDEFLLGLDLK